MATGSKSVSLSGIEDIVAAFSWAPEQMRQAVNQAITAAATDVGLEADNLVPEDTGALRSSQNIGIRDKGEVIEAEVSYGDTATPYALVQHERLDFWHPPKPPGKSVVGKRSGTGPGTDPSTGRGPKYLERPFMEETANYPEKMAQRIRVHFRLLGRGK
jgi:hypothetical protein